MYKKYFTQMQMSADAGFAPVCRSARNAASCFVRMDAAALAASIFVLLLAVRIIYSGIP